MNWFKTWLMDFPGQNGGVVVALFLLLVTGMNVNVRFARGLTFPDGYEPFLWVLLALAGVNVAGMGIKRFTDIEYRKAGTSAVSVDSATVTALVSQAPPAVESAPAPETLLVAATSAPAPATRQTVPVAGFPLPTQASD